MAAQTPVCHPPAHVVQNNHVGANGVTVAEPMAEPPLGPSSMAEVSLEQRGRIQQLCRELAAVGVSQRSALQALSQQWPTPGRVPGRRLRILDCVYIVQDEALLSREAGYFQRLFGGDWREGPEDVVDLSEVPMLKRSPALMQAFLDLVDAGADRVAEESAATGDKQDLQTAMDLLQLSNYFEAPRIEEWCVDVLAAQRHTILASESARQALRELPWTLLERLLASIESKLEVIELVAAWCVTPEDESSRYLQRRCETVEDIAAGDMLRLCMRCPHIMAKLPPRMLAQFFGDMLNHLESVMPALERMLCSALPRFESHHPGCYTPHDPVSGGGWSCCNSKALRVAGCAQRVVLGVQFADSQATHGGRLQEFLACDRLDKIVARHASALEQVVGAMAS